ncbi:MAG: polysaccharide deacetylase family protein [Magnetospirillum sp.]|nr:polysaccharide deacetylase family protein [Magnetospirillum sp.]
MALRYTLAPPLRTVNRLWRHLTGQGGGIRFLLFHDIAASQMPVFETLVATLARSGLLASPDEAAVLLSGGAASDRQRCVITFDDGFASNIQACDIVERHGAKAMLFLCPRLMELDPQDQRRSIAATIFDGRVSPDCLAPDLRLMNWPEVQELARRGHTIGSHTMTHRRLSTLSASALESEVGDAKTMLEKRLGCPMEWFAFPFGDIDSIDASALSVIGRHHRFCRSGIRGCNRPGIHRLALLADHVELGAPRGYQHLAIEGGLDGRYRQARRRLAELTEAVAQ